MLQLNDWSRTYLEWQDRWIDRARPKQIAPSGKWDVWANVAGRGYGKTRLGAEWSGALGAARQKQRIAVVGATRNDVKSVCFEGESGLLNIIPESMIPRNGWNRSTLELELKNGSIFYGYSAEKPDRIRGPQFHAAWCDELASWGAAAGASTRKAESVRLQEAWDNLRFALRLGVHPQICVTTTPRPLQFLKDLIRDPRTVTRGGSTFENSDNLAQNSLDAFRRVYEGTRKGRQELFAEILDTAEGALWTVDALERHRVDDIPEGVRLVRIGVGVDPAVTSEESSDEWGVIVAGLGDDGRIYVLLDGSKQYAPRDAARAILTIYERHQCDFVCAETNQGGDLVEAVLRSEDLGVHFAYKSVRAKRGKYLRAEPIAAYYEKGQVSHVGIFRQLENQMLNFTGSTSDGSPDRLDALVYVVGELMFGQTQHAFW